MLRKHATFHFCLLYSSTSSGHSFTPNPTLTFPEFWELPQRGSPMRLVRDSERDVRWVAMRNASIILIRFAYLTRNGTETMYVPLNVCSFAFNRQSFVVGSRCTEKWNVKVAVYSEIQRHKTHENGYVSIDFFLLFRWEHSGSFKQSLVTVHTRERENEPSFMQNYFPLRRNTKTINKVSNKPNLFFDRKHWNKSEVDGWNFGPLKTDTLEYKWNPDKTNFF